MKRHNYFSVSSIPEKGKTREQPGVQAMPSPMSATTREPARAAARGRFRERPGDEDQPQHVRHMRQPGTSAIGKAPVAKTTLRSNDGSDTSTPAQHPTPPSTRLSKETPRHPGAAGNSQPAPAFPCVPAPTPTRDPPLSAASPIGAHETRRLALPRSPRPSSCREPNPTRGPSRQRPAR